MSSSDKMNKLSGTLSHEREVNVTAAEAWKLVGSLQLTKIIDESVSKMSGKVVVLEGDGGVGTLIEAFFPEGIGMDGLSPYQEKFVIVDHIQHLKVVEVVEGGYLNFGFTLYRVKLEVILKDNDEDCCIIRATIEYEMEKEHEANVSLVSIKPMVAILQLAVDCLEH